MVFVTYKGAQKLIMPFFSSGCAGWKRRVFPEFVNFLRVCDWFGSSDVVLEVTGDKKKKKERANVRKSLMERC